MRRKLTLLVLACCAVMVTALYARRVRATPASGFMATTLAKGTFGEFEVLNHFILPNVTDDDKKIWLSLQKTRGESDLYVQSNLWQPAQRGLPVASTGWHSHLGHSLIIVTAGTLTAYDGNDPTCAPHVYTVGMGFVDPGGGNVHIVRNEGAVVAQSIAVQLIPAGQQRRIDVSPAPGNCPF